MKSLFALVALTFCYFSVSAQDDIKFSTLKHSFGKIKQNKPVSFSFKFINKGSKALIVESATAGCGCTTPEYPKTPIVKGKEEEIKVTYNAAAPGTFKKDVTVKFANHPKPIILEIEGEVIPDGTKPNPDH